MLELLEENPNADFLALQMKAEASVKAFVKDYIHIIGSNDRYAFTDFERLAGVARTTTTHATTEGITQ